APDPLHTMKVCRCIADLLGLRLIPKQGRRSFATISSGLYRFLAIAVLLHVKDIPQVGPLQWGWISAKDLNQADAKRWRAERKKSPDARLGLRANPRRRDVSLKAPQGTV